MCASIAQYEPRLKDLRDIIYTDYLGNDDPHQHGYRRGISALHVLECESGKPSVVYLNVMRGKNVTPETPAEEMKRISSNILLLVGEILAAIGGVHLVDWLL